MASEPAPPATAGLDEWAVSRPRSPWPLPTRMDPADQFYAYDDEEEGNRGVWTDLHHSYFIARDAESATIHCVTQRQKVGPPRGPWTDEEPKIVAQVRTGPGLPDLLRHLAEHFTVVERATRSLEPAPGWHDLPEGLCCRFAGFELEIIIAADTPVGPHPDSSLIVQSGSRLGQGLEWDRPHPWLGALAAHLDSGADQSRTP